MGWGAETLDNTKPYLKARGRARHAAAVPKVPPCKSQCHQFLSTQVKAAQLGSQLKPKGNILSCLCNTLCTQRPPLRESMGQRPAGIGGKKATEINNIKRGCLPSCNYGGPMRHSGSMPRYQQPIDAQIK